MRNERLFKILLSPRVSEKSNNILSLNQYVFKVLKSATKHEIKQAVESLFNVKVENVRTLTVKPKNKRFNQMQGVQKGWKKAYVKLKDGYKLDIAGPQA